MKRTFYLSLLASLFIPVISRAQTFSFAESFGGPGIDVSYTMVMDSSGYLYLTGQFNGTADLDPGAGVFNLTSAGGYDIFIIKLDSLGNFIWAKSFGGALFEKDPYVTNDTSGNFYISGSFEGTADFDPGSNVINLTSAGDFDIFVTKFDTAGNLLWVSSMGGTLEDRSIGISVDHAGNSYITGQFSGTCDFDPSPSAYLLTAPGQWTDAYIEKLDPAGNMVWAYQLGNTNGEAGHAITCDSAGNTFCTGMFAGTLDFDPGTGVYNITGPGTYFSMYILKLDPAGNFVWARAIGGNDTNQPSNISLDHSGNILLCGFYDGTCDFDPGTSTSNLSSPGDFDIFVLKLDPAGNFQWAVAYNGSQQTDKPTRVHCDRYNNVYTTGHFEGTADFDPGVGAYNLTAAGGIDIFIARLTANGTFIDAYRMGGTDYDQGGSLVITSGDRVYSTGTFGMSGDFDPTTGVFTLTSAGSVDSYIQKMVLPFSNNGGIGDGLSEEEVHIFPNPTNGNVTISVPLKSCTLEIFSMLGEMVLEREMHGQQVVDLSSLGKGAFLIRIASEKGSLTKKIIKE
jgi:hypothetical protein